MLHLNLAANPRFTNPRLPLAPLRLDLPPVPSGPVRVADAPHTRHDPTVSESLSLSLYQCRKNRPFFEPSEFGRWKEVEALERSRTVLPPKKGTYWRASSGVFPWWRVFFLSGHDRRPEMWRRRAKWLRGTGSGDFAESFGGLVLR